MLLYSARGDIMEKIKENSQFSDKEAREFIALLFDGYQKRKEEKRLYGNEEIPIIIIKAYYSFVTKPDFSRIVKSFKKRYIFNENKIEEVHSREEINGLGAVYDYIQTFEDLENISIYDLSYIHEVLYSLTPHPEFGGRYRTMDARLAGTRIELSMSWNIVHEMNDLRPEVNDIVKMGIELRNNFNTKRLIEYIDRCIMLKCKLIKIHPFGDGNGRSIRAFMNLLFRLVNIPPTYIEEREKDAYYKAMGRAIGDGDLSEILDFYHYKICDSIIELDIKVKNNEMENDYIDEPKKM